MNRYGNVERVFDVAIKSLIEHMKPKCPNGVWQCYVTRHILDIYNEKMNDCRFDVESHRVGCRSYPPVSEDGV